MMRTGLYIMIALLVSMMPATALAEIKLDKEIKKILNSNLPVQKAADSALWVVNEYSLRNPNREAYLECANVNVKRLIPFVEKHHVELLTRAIICDMAAQDFLRAGQDNLEKFKHYNDKALEYARLADSQYYQARILDHRYLFEANYGDAQKGYELANEAIKLYKQCGKDCDRYITALLYGQAAIYLRSNDIAGIKKIADKLKEFITTARPENRDYVRYNYYSIHSAYYSVSVENGKSANRKADIDSINDLSLKTIQLLESAKGEWGHYSVNPQWDYYNRAVFFINYKEHPSVDSVEYYLNRGQAMNKKGLMSTQIEYAISADQLRAEMWMKHGSFEKAKDILLKLIDKIGKAEGFNNLISDKCETYKCLIEISRQSGHYKEALEYMETLSQLERERYDSKRAEALKDAEVKYQTQETELALAQSEAKKNNILMWLFAATGLLLIAIIIFVAYANRQRRRRLQKEVETANLRAEVGKQYIEGLEAERSRMASELHDGVCNDLLAIHKNLKNGGNVEAADHLIQTCYESVRRISHELMPPEFDYASLDEVIRFYIAKQSEVNKGAIEFEYKSNADEAWSVVPERTALEAYRICQEAIGNAVKHSGANHIGVTLELDSRKLTLRIIDNGHFISQGKSGIGLSSIIKRANALGGHIAVAHPENAGTELFLTIIL